MTKSAAIAVPLDPADDLRAAQVLTRAFMADPIYKHIFPDPELRARHTPRLWRALIRTCRAFGAVHTTAGLEGVACWTSPGNADLTFGQLLRTGFALSLAVIGFPSEPRRRMLQMLAMMDGQRRKLVPDALWYLQALGVDPTRQGKGVGSGLIEPILAKADAEGCACYLETETEGNVAFYEKRGFEVMAVLELPGASLKLWAMRRDPHPAGLEAS